jgi:hypothetical protein
VRHFDGLCDDEVAFALDITNRKVQGDLQRARLLHSAALHGCCAAARDSVRLEAYFS